MEEHPVPEGEGKTRTYLDVPEIAAAFAMWSLDKRMRLDRALDLVSTGHESGVGLSVLHNVTHIYSDTFTMISSDQLKGFTRLRTLENIALVLDPSDIMDGPRTFGAIPFLEEAIIYPVVPGTTSLDLLVKGYLAYGKRDIANLRLTYIDNARRGGRLEVLMIKNGKVFTGVVGIAIWYGFLSSLNELEFGDPNDPNLPNISFLYHSINMDDVVTFANVDSEGMLRSPGSSDASPLARTAFLNRRALRQSGLILVPIPLIELFESTAYGPADPTGPMSDINNANDIQAYVDAIVETKMMNGSKLIDLIALTLMQKEGGIGEYGSKDPAFYSEKKMMYRTNKYIMSFIGHRLGALASAGYGKSIVTFEGVMYIDLYDPNIKDIIDDNVYKISNTIRGPGIKDPAAARHVPFPQWTNAAVLDKAPIPIFSDITFTDETVYVKGTSYKVKYIIPAPPKANSDKYIIPFEYMDSRERRSEEELERVHRQYEAKRKEEREAKRKAVEERDRVVTRGYRDSTTNSPYPIRQF